VGKEVRRDISFPVH